MDTDEQILLTDTLRKTMTTTTGAALYTALRDLGWHDLLTGPADTAEVAVPLVFRLLGETGAHAPLLNDVIAHAAGRPFGEAVPLPFTGGTWVRWDSDGPPGTPEPLDADLPLRRLGDTTELPVAAAELPIGAARRALGWWLVGSARAMLGLARTHALERHQFGKPVAGFQAIRHRLAESLVAVEGAEATLAVSPGDAHHPAHPDLHSPRPEESESLGALLAKAAAGRAALVTARNCQQVLGGIGFTAEHEFHRHYRRVLVLDGLLGSARELTREAGATLRDLGYAPRLAHL
ncbi:acyl-CoA dehydrogenase family protein [Nocardia jinanensis]|uniref:Acyl-CoA dehydrogenase n=1 Tax=Nocardia jinanensis TaxID=382504 RepID=A0A917RQ08_9NOCA|nr:acyl-CoA dehydrogenase family protein [Nocardia jinanensis]GGL18732.1 acyl-CoA dehydrogenase [Nocardia jinanensis]